MSEIEEFLKRAAAMRARQQGTASPSPRPTPAPPAISRISSPLSTRAPSSIVQDAEVVEAEEVSGDDVADYVSRHLDSSLFSQRASRLGVDVKSADEQIESHLHSTFEHRLGQLGGMTARADDSSLDDDENAAAAAATALRASATIADLLRSPQQIRNAIVLSEILNPPTDRW